LRIAANAVAEFLPLEMHERFILLSSIFDAGFFLFAAFDWRTEVLVFGFW
jgi:hypothetical protein